MILFVTTRVLNHKIAVELPFKKKKIAVEFTACLVADFCSSATSTQNDRITVAKPAAVRRHQLSF